MSKVTKSQYVLYTNQLIREEGLENVSVRKITSHFHCTSGALYKHFPDFDYLIALACIHCMKEYMEAVEPLAKRQNTIETNLYAWKLFIMHAFKKPDIFYTIFYGPYHYTMSKVFQEYCEMFPKEFSNLSPVQMSILLNNRIEERDFLGIQDSIGMEIPDVSTAKQIARIDGCIFRTLLTENREKKSAKVLMQAARECFSLIEANEKRFLK